MGKTGAHSPSWTHSSRAEPNWGFCSYRGVYVLLFCRSSERISQPSSSFILGFIRGWNAQQEFREFVPHPSNPSHNRLHDQQDQRSNCTGGLVLGQGAEQPGHCSPPATSPELIGPNCQPVLPKVSSLESSGKTGSFA